MSEDLLYPSTGRQGVPCEATDPAWVASTADGPILAAEEQGLKRKLWVAAIKPPMYSVGIAPIVVGDLFLILSPCISCIQIEETAQLKHHSCFSLLQCKFSVTGTGLPTVASPQRPEILPSQTLPEVLRGGRV